MKLPFVKFFPRDWMGDDRLRLCSLPARGLWIDLLCLMHSSPRRGYLQTATGSPLPLEQIARMTGCSTDEATHLLRELIDSGTCDCTEHGMIYSRRMVREESKREKCSNAGKQGGGNPAFKGQSKGGDKGSPKQNPKPQILRGSEAQKEDPPTPRNGGKRRARSKLAEEAETDPRFVRFWEAYPKKVGKADAARAFRKIDPNPELLNAILAGLEVWKRCPRWNKDGGEFIKFAEGWLNGKRWEEIPTSQGTITPIDHKARDAKIKADRKASEELDRIAREESGKVKALLDAKLRGIGTGGEA